MEFETVAIRAWKGYWAKGENVPTFSAPKGGYVITFHKGEKPPYKVEYYVTVEEIREKYPKYAWMEPHANDPKDIVLVGI